MSDEIDGETGAATVSSREVLASLAKEIEREATLAEDAASTALEHAIRAGELLIEAKGHIPHGIWLTWLYRNFCQSAERRRVRSERTAQVYMQLARRAASLDPQRSADLSISGAMKMLATRNERTPLPARSFRAPRMLAKSLNDLVLAAHNVDPGAIRLVRAVAGEGSSVEADELRAMAQWLNRAADALDIEPGLHGDSIDDYEGSIKQVYSREATRIKPAILSAQHQAEVMEALPDPATAPKSPVESSILDDLFD